MTYFLAFFGRPRGGASLAVSRASYAYIASLHTGLIPALCRSFFTASVVFPESSAIQRTVKKMVSVCFSPFIYIVFIVGNSLKMFTSGENKQKYSPLGKIFIDKYHQ